MAKGRTFTIEMSCINVSGGRYKSSSPFSAAKKAASKLFKKSESMPRFKNIRKITFTLRETTSGGDKSEYHYKAGRLRLSQPIVRVINGVQIVNRYKIEIVAIENNKVKTASNGIKCRKVSKSLSGGEGSEVESVDFEVS